VDGRHYRRLHVLVERGRQPVEVILHNLELASPGQRMRNMQSCPDPAAQLSIVHIAMQANTVESRRLPELSVANRVTSTPRATSPSVCRLAVDSHGP
jgi:hypothetical protein